jgi:quinol-cytochrome oxidoreductase complex cytochrome b subunit
MKRSIIQATIFSVMTMLLYFGYQIGVGMYTTYSYTPDIIHAYSNIDYLQNKVSFGVISHPFSFPIETILLLMISFIVFLTGKYMLRKLKR